MQLLNNSYPEPSDKHTLRFRRQGSQSWEVREGVRSIKAFVESVGDKPSDNGEHAGSEWGRGEKYNDEAMPEYCTWQKQVDGQWRALTMDDMA